MSTRSAKNVASEARSSTPFRFLARVGFAVNGLLHILIGFIAIGVATGAGGKADQSGALGQIASTPGGVFVLWTTAIGLAALGVWLIVGAFVAPSTDKKKVAHSVAEAAKGVAYLAIGGTALTFAQGGSSDGESSVDSASAMLLATPGGVIVLLILGLAVVGIGVYFVVKGVKRSFLDDIVLPAGKRGKPVVVLGIVGYVAKGIALAFAGVLVAIAAVRADPSQAAGLDGSLKALAELPLGQIILVLIGLGFVAYGIYCFARARLARL